MQEHSPGEATFELLDEDRDGVHRSAIVLEESLDPTGPIRLLMQVHRLLFVLAMHRAVAGFNAFKWLELGKRPRLRSLAKKKEVDWTSEYRPKPYATDGLQSSHQ